MDTKAITAAIDSQLWIDNPADALQKGISNAFRAGGKAGEQVQDALHGVWMGHPLHPALTDIPIGAWTVAMVLDVIDIVQGRDDLGPGADAAIAVGIAGATGAAVTGLTDWHVLGEEKTAKRVGFSHMLFNVAALGLFTSSLVTRKKNRTVGRMLGFLGYAAATAGAYLGGSLVYEEGLGVDHAQRELPTGWIAVCDSKDLKEGKMMKVKAGEIEVCLVKQHGQIFAIGDKCSHLGGPLHEGELGEGCVTCPWHASRFSLADGAVEHGPATFPQVSFATRVHEGKIEVRARREHGQ
jgi:nitrite reductase/ring-hydroxylating ferredoxin subunit/uncharacterized membrane protein